MKTMFSYKQGRNNDGIVVYEYRYVRGFRKSVLIFKTQITINN